MLGMTDRTTAANIRSTFAAISVDPPKSVTAAYAKAEKLTEKASHLGSEPGALEAAVTDAILAGREVHTDPAVTAGIVGQALASNQAISEAVAGVASDLIRGACFAELDNIVNAWAVAFDQAVNELKEAHDRIGDLPLDDTTAILAKGRDIADVWAEAQNADRTIDVIVGGWTSLMQMVRVSVNPDQRALRLAELTLDQWQTIPAKAKAWDLIRAGIRPDLPTLDEYRRRIALIQNARTAIDNTPDVDHEREATKAWGAKVERVRREELMA